MRIQGLGNSRKDLLAFYILFTTSCLKWLFEGVFGQPAFEVFFLFLGVFALIIKNGVSINRLSAVWLLYSFNILLSVLFHSPTIAGIGRALIMVGIVCYLQYEKYDLSKYSIIYKYVIKLAFVFGFFELLQFVFKSRFTNVYYSFLKTGNEEVATKYSSKGYYTGLIYNPHEIATLLSVAFVALILWQFLKRKFSLSKSICSVFLLFLMLLTQKKGVIGIALIMLVAVICLLFLTKKQWSKIFSIIISCALVLLVIFVYIKSHPDSVVFHRLIIFIEKIVNNESADSGRLKLWGYAWNEFMENKLFGIGWKKFMILTKTKYEYKNGHEVNFDYLQWLCETGIVGFCLNITPVIVMLRRTIMVCKRYLKNELDMQKKWSVMIAIFTQFFVVVYAFIEIPFYDILIFTMYIFSCVVINAAYRTVNVAHKSKRIIALRGQPQ